MQDAIAAREQEPRVPGVEGLHLVHAVGASGGDESEIITDVLRAAGAVLGCEHPVLLLAGADSGDLRVYTLLDDGARIAVPCWEESGLLRRALHQGRDVALYDVTTEPDPGPVLARMFRAEQLVAAPLALDGRTLGVIGGVNTSADVFSRRELDALTVVAGRAAVAIDGCRRRRRLEARVEELEDVLRRGQSSADYVSILGHELKGPLSNVLGFASALKDQWAELPEERRERSLDLIVRETGRLSRLVGDILDLSRLESGTLCCDLAPVDLRALVFQTVDASSPLATRHDVVIDVVDDLPQVLADADRLKQVVINLLSNATAYSPEGSSITVHAEVAADPGEVHVSVADEGIGLTREDAERIFDKFTRVGPASSESSASSASPQGSGLGLYIARGIVEAHGGRMWVESEPGAGSIFSLSLPVAVAD